MAAFVRNLQRSFAFVIERGGIGSTFDQQFHDVSAAFMRSFVDGVPKECEFALGFG
jgi:hypothetical protein